MKYPLPPFASLPLLAALLLGVLMAPLARGLTLDTNVTPAYVNEHSKEFSVTVTKAKNGLLEFTIVQNAQAPWYIVASLAVRKDGNLLSETYFPPFVKQNDIRFSFRLAPELVNDAVFEIGNCAFGKNGDEIIPLPGTNNYVFKLKDFLPLPEAPKTAAAIPPPKP